MRPAAVKHLGTLDKSLKLVEANEPSFPEISGSVLNATRLKTKMASTKQEERSPLCSPEESGVRSPPGPVNEVGMLFQSQGYRRARPRGTEASERALHKGHQKICGSAASGSERR